MAITAIKGINDILPDEAGKWQLVEASARRIFAAFGYREIRVPIIEKTELFARSIGESTDIVESIELCEGYPAEVILRKAEDLGCDVIVMGTHGKGFLSHTFLGSTAQKVLRRVNKPVFIIPLPKEETDITFHDAY